MSHEPHDPSFRETVDQVARDNDLERTQEFELPDEEGVEETREFELPQESGIGEREDFEATQAFPVEEAAAREGAEEEKFRAPLVNRSLFRSRDEDDDQPTEVYHEPTAVLPVEEVGGSAAGATAVGAPRGGMIARTPSEVDADVLRSQREAEQRRAIEDEHRRRREAEAARQRALGVVAAPAEEPAPAAPVRPARRTTDKWLPSLGLLLFRWAIAAILGIRGYQMITDISGTRDLMTKIGLPYLEYFPWALAIALMLAALGLLFGLGVRIIGLCVAALAVCVLAMVKWGVVPIFQSGMSGFIGELEVLLAAAGFLLFTLGGGGWGIDGGWRRNRMRDKYGVE